MILAGGLLEKVFVSLLLLAITALLLVAPRNQSYGPPKGWVSVEKPRTVIDRFMRPYGAETIRVYLFRPDGQWRPGAKASLVVLLVITVAAIWSFA